jgi:hypothetical protein
METPNAFIGKTTLPTPEEVSAALGSTAEVWKQLVDWLAEAGSRRSGVEVIRRQVRLVPAPQAEEENDRLPRSVRWVLPRGLRPWRQGGCGRPRKRTSKGALKLLDEAPRYAEGTGCG